MVDQGAIDGFKLRFTQRISEIHSGNPGANGRSQLFYFHGWILPKKYSPDACCYDIFLPRNIGLTYDCGHWQPGGRKEPNTK